ncbi:hypothetical protein SLG_38160 [Sphingobium sp. SYK-6]|uniref:hypothetical protein n=1 Tax=Sphingobium sp. (strain NBRC 103272 / SYK-6) TaxID=627192 RepID=UPI0002277F63|nr:hypothetical protein [Sphingobium sp. SYK-6]BAK68491.1 hypothetical protein SLG_38160 [Sphingobium sp. SYK-6]
MQHFGDLQPLGRPDFFAEQAPVGRYSARRSRWRFAVGSLEVGFDRASETIDAETPRQQAGPRLDFAQRLMILVGTISCAALLLALAGWMWSKRGSSIMGGETVSAAIIDREDAAAPARPDETPVVIPTKAVPTRLTAVIERQAAAPAVAPTKRASVAIAQGEAIAPKAAAIGPASAPDEAIVASGNYLLIPSVAHALSTAMASGEAQNWVAGNYHGLVVVGDAELKDSKRCRQGTVLLRDGSLQGRTQRFERCL